MQSSVCPFLCRVGAVYAAFGAQVFTIVIHLYISVTNLAIALNIHIGVIQYVAVLATAIYRTLHKGMSADGNLGIVHISLVGQVGILADVIATLAGTEYMTDVLRHCHVIRTNLGITRHNHRCRTCTHRAGCRHGGIDIIVRSYRTHVTAAIYAAFHLDTLVTCNTGIVGCSDVYRSISPDI